MIGIRFKTGKLGNHYLALLLLLIVVPREAAAQDPDTIRISGTALRGESNEFFTEGEILYYSIPGDGGGSVPIEADGTWEFSVPYAPYQKIEFFALPIGEFTEMLGSERYEIFPAPPCNINNVVLRVVPRYSVIDPWSRPGEGYPTNESCLARDMNNNEVVIGTRQHLITNTADQNVAPGTVLPAYWSTPRGFRWSMTGGFVDFTEENANVQIVGINDRGDVSGSMNSVGNFQEAFVWPETPAQGDFVTLSPGSGFPPSIAAGINDPGTIVGCQQQAVVGGAPGDQLEVPFIHPENGQTFSPLPFPPFMLAGEIAGTGCMKAVNKHGDSVGRAFLPLRVPAGPGVSNRAILWRAGAGFVDLGAIVGDQTRFSEALDINQYGEVVGRFNNANGIDVAFLWSSSEGTVHLPLPPDATNAPAVAKAINSQSSAVGTYQLEANQHAAILWKYREGPGEFYSLRLDKAVAERVKYEFSNAIAITDSDSILVTGSLPPRAFETSPRQGCFYLLRPNPNPLLRLNDLFSVDDSPPTECSDIDPSPEPTPEDSPYPVPSLEPEPTPEDSPYPVPSLEPEPTPEDSPYPVSSLEPEPTPEDSPYPVPLIEPEPY